MTKKSYEDVSIAEIAAHAKISIGGFYSRFDSKEALYSELLNRLGQETDEKIEAALAKDWSKTSLQDLLLFVVASNAEIYDKYRGILAVVHLKTRLLQPDNDKTRLAYNEGIVVRIEKLLMLKRDDIRRRQPKVAIRLAVACMSAMLRDAIVFGDTSLYAKPVNRASISRHVADFMHLYLAGDAS